MQLQKTLITTFDISKTIKNYCIKQKIDSKYIDFNILKIDFIYKTKLSNKVISKDELLKIKDSKSYANSIQQKFKIEIFHKNKVKFIINHKVFVNKYSTKAFSVVSSKSKILYYAQLKEDLIDYFNKEKAKRKMMISIFDDTMINDISLLAQHIKNTNKVPKNTKITMASKTSYIASVENELLYKYLPKNMTKDDLINCYCFVKDKQHVISYTQGFKGSNGLDIYGKFRKAKEIRNKKDLSFNVSKNLEIINNEEESHVVAKTDGVLVFDNEQFDIRNNLSFDSLDFRAVRYFDIPLENEDIVINIISKREFENAISSRATIKAHNINIKGDIDSKATIIAVNLKCDGNIHHSAILRAKNANLKILKGKLKAENVQIKTVENGLVIADNIEVESIVGGELRAKNIKINSLYSNNTIKCSKLLEIAKMEGDNNNLHISMNADLDLKLDIKRYKQSLLDVKKIDSKNIPIIKRKYVECQRKNKILEAKIKEKTSNKKEVQKNILLNKNMLDALEQDINAVEYRNTLISNLKKIDEFLYQTKIILKNGWNGDNIVVYDYVYKKDNIRAIPKRSIKHISLVNKNNQDIIKII